MPFYLAAYTLVIMLALPATLVTILGGAIFGAVKGGVLAWTGAMLGTAVTHVVAHTIGRRAVQRLLGKHSLLERLRKRAGVWDLIRLRLLPVAPFGVLDYVAGLAGVALKPLLIATGIGILANVAAYAYVGHRLAVGFERGYPPGDRALWIAGVVTVVMASISILPTLIGRIRGQDSQTER